MGRLEQYQNQKLRKTIYLSLFILVTLILVLFTFGFRIVLNATSFIAGLGNKETEQAATRKENLIEDIDIDNIPLATNSAKIAVGGSVFNFNQVEFYLNGDLVKEKNLGTAEEFSEEIGDLEQGENEVYVIGKSKDSESEKKSKVFTVIFKGKKPKLDIKEPGDGNKSNNQDIRIVGETDKEAYIRVNDLPVVVDAQGIFQTNFRLKEGENKIILTATDVAGNKEEKTLTLTYEKD